MQSQSKISEVYFDKMRMNNILKKIIIFHIDIGEVFVVL